MKMLAIWSVCLLHPFALAAAQLDVEHYDIDVDVRDDKLVEQVTLRVKATSIPKTWTLTRANSIRVHSVKCESKDVPFKMTDWALDLDLSGLRKAPAFELTLTAEGRPYNKFSKNRGGYVRTCVTPEITYIRSQYPWYPRAKDDPATVRTTVRAKAEWTVRTAGDLRERTAGEQGMTWTFEQAKPTRNVGLVAGPYRQVKADAGGFVLDALVFERHRDQAKTLLEIARRAHEFYGGRFGEVGASRFTLVEMPAEFGAGSGYGETGYVLIGEGAFTAAGHAPWAESLVAHEVSHTWWGREVGFKNFASESLACYATLMYLEEVVGADAAKRERRAAVDRVLRVAAAGKEVALTEIRNWGGGMDPQTYRAHAYEKGMMILAMMERGVGKKKMNATLAKLFEAERGNTIDWPALKRRLVSAGGRTRAVLDRFEQPGIPRLREDHTVKRSGMRYRVTGTVHQEGTPRPMPMTVEIVARSGGKRVAVAVAMTGTKKRFSFVTPFEPTAVRIDPDYRLLAARPTAGDPKEIVNAAFEVVNSPNDADVGRLRRTIATLEGVLQGDPGDSEGLCYTGIGRCSFRLGTFDNAIPAFEKALKLGAGGPFHRAWIHFRLGCIADVRGKRKAAIAHYREAVQQGMKYTAAKRAAGCIEKPYPGYNKAK